MSPPSSDGTNRSKCCGPITWAAPFASRLPRSYDRVSSENLWAGLRLGRATAAMKSSPAPGPLLNTISTGSAIRPDGRPRPQAADPFYAPSCHSRTVAPPSNGPYSGAVLSRDVSSGCQNPTEINSRAAPTRPCSEGLDGQLCQLATLAAWLRGCGERARNPPIGDDLFVLCSSSEVGCNEAAMQSRGSSLAGIMTDVA